MANEPRDLSRSLSDAAKALTDKGAQVVGGFFRRTLVHVGALAAAIVCAASSGAQSALPLGVGGRVLLGIATYVGVINLFPRAPYWLATGLGLAAAVLLLIAGMPWQALLLFGGGMTLLARLILGGEAAGRPRSAVIVYVIAAGLAMYAMTAIPAAFPPLWRLAVPLAVVVALTCLAKPIYERWQIAQRARQRQQALALTAQDAVQHLAALPGTGPTSQSMRELADATRRFLTILPEDRQLAEEDATLLRRVAALADALPMDQVEPDEDAADAALSLTSALDARRALALAEAQPRPLRGPELTQEQADRVKDFQAQAAALLAQARPLPAALRKQVEAICVQAGHMLEQVSLDARKFSQTSAFLARYLPAAKNLLTVSGRGPGIKLGEAEATALEATLVRLADAFSAQRARLLQDDTMDVRVEIGVVEKLLKMDGH